MNDKIELISGLLAGLYILARVIVLLTPTSTDDEWIRRYAPKWLKILGVVFGLDLKQGIKKYGPQ